MYYCNNCNNSIKFNEESFITQCSNCGWFSRIKVAKIIELEVKKKDHQYAEINTNIKLRKLGNEILICYRFDIKYLENFKEISRKTGEALEKFLDYDKNGLSNKEKNFLYKLKANSIKKIRNQIAYLQAKEECIKLLRNFDF